MKIIDFKFFSTQKPWPMGLIIVTFLCNINNAFSQSDSLSAIDLPIAKLTALRIEATPRKQPFSIATFQLNPSLANGQQLSLQEYITEIPGLFSLNANNYAQDLRVAIRGFGARSAFGIRGIKLIVDGIPETTPDGQGQLDNLTLNSIERIEVLKGPSSALYGNASGGVINMTTQNKFEKNYLAGGIQFGSFGMQRYILSAGKQFKNGNISFGGAHTFTNGFRKQSGFQSTNLDLKGTLRSPEKSKLTFLVNYTNSPIGDDPGGVTLKDVEVNRKAARDRNITFKTGEALDQFKLGATYEKQVNESQILKLNSFYNFRNFEGRLPFEFGGWINLKRTYGGIGATYSFNKSFDKFKNTLLLGFDAAFQSDDRKRYLNQEGNKGTLTLDQVEIFSNGAGYILDHFTINKLMLTAGLRFDYNRIELVDEKIDDGDQSGDRALPTLNPSIGWNYEMGERMHLYGSFRTSFETPVLSELTANPSGEAGLNESLDPQTAYNYEIGYKGLLGQKMDFDLTLYHINTNNDLVPYELEDFPGRTFFRNAGSTTRQGIETWINYRFTSELNLRSSYTFSNFKYKSFRLGNDNFDGKLLPGIPKHSASFSLNYQSNNGISARIVHRIFSQFFANDSNETEIPSYQITDLNLGYQLKIKKGVITPSFGINNLFNVAYFDNIRLNAFGSRFYEAAPGINIYGGVRVKF